jgi:hypothetical protein
MRLHRRWIALILMLFLLSLAGSQRALAREEQTQENAASEAPAASFQRTLRPGEIFTLGITWRPPVWLFFIPPISAGTITLEIKELIDYEQSPAVRIVGDARSSGTFNSLAGINVQNHYESIVDLKSGCSLQFKLMQREGKRMQDVQIDFDRGAKKLHIREWNVSKDPHIEFRNESIDTGDGCIQDLISIFYAIRAVQLRTGIQHTLVLSNDHGKVQPIQLTVEGEEKARTDGGTYQVYRVSTTGLFGGLFRSGGEFKVWIDQSSGIPVKFDAKVKLGRVTGSLLRLKPGQ